LATVGADGSSKVVVEAELNWLETYGSGCVDEGGVLAERAGNAGHGPHVGNTQVNSADTICNDERSTALSANT